MTRNEKRQEILIEIAKKTQNETSIQNKKNIYTQRAVTLYTVDNNIKLLY